jgi:uncharacterized SAM-binding protein YcdF (DUF218 family)
MGRLARLAAVPVLAWRIEQSGRRPVPSGAFDAIIVPGCRVHEDGRPSGALCKRVDFGVTLWRQRRAPLLVMSGRGGGGRPEAVVMAERAIEAGVPESALVVEDQSMTTLENAARVRERIDGNRVLVATDTTHARRCARIFGAQFEDAVAVGVPLAPRSRFRMALREAVIEAWQG